MINELSKVNTSLNSNTAKLWDKYKQTGDKELRNKLVMLYMHLVEITAKKMYHVFSNKASIEDIISNGMITLIKAVESYDPNRDVKFETYASLRIRGSVIDYIRGQDWVPRTARDKVKRIETCYEKIKARTGREPGYKEIAEEMGITQSEVENILYESHSYNIISFEEIVNFNIKDNCLSPQDHIIERETKEKLAKAIDSLPEKERLVISLFYYEELRVKDIASVMGISSSRVCQIHSMALVRIRKALNSYLMLAR
ncbi:MAG: FliA/WhiG family RNA polymerase sigma factor [Oscillospiraceae bacterium]|nr:FliA/WhiG family RNA polymerase sigma factor [Oscillospiraceae bacterium]